MSKNKETNPLDINTLPFVDKSVSAYEEIVLDDQMRKLLQNLKAGNQQAFEEIYYRWNTRIFSLLKSLLRYSDDAEDITQDVFIKIWENREKIDPERNFNGFIYRIARNIALQFIAKLKVRSDYADRTSFEQEDLNSDEFIMVKQTEERIMEIVKRMPERRRKIFLMNIEEGLDNTTISQKLNLTKETVKKELHLARKQLRQLLSLIALFLLMS